MKELLLKELSLRFHRTDMAAAGHKSIDAIETTVKGQGGYILVVAGSISKGEGGENRSFGLEK